MRWLAILCTAVCAMTSVMAEEPARREAWGGDPPKGDTPGFYNGLLDEVKVWARALTADEMRAESDRGK